MRLKWLSFIGGIFTLEFVGFSNCQVKGGTSESCFGKPFRLLSEDPGTRSWEGEGRSRGDNPPRGSAQGPQAPAQGPQAPAQGVALRTRFPGKMQRRLLAPCLSISLLLPWPSGFGVSSGEHFIEQRSFPARLLWTPDLFSLMMYAVASSDVRDSRKETFCSTHHVSF